MSNVKQPNNNILSFLFQAWTWRMALRDSKMQKGRLLLYMSAVVLGIAVITAISSYSENLQMAIQTQAKSLLGADIQISSLQPFSSILEARLDSLALSHSDFQLSKEIVFGSMAYFPKNRQTRLVQVRALGGDYPYYGHLETLPKDAYELFREGLGVLVDGSLMLQYSLTPGDTIYIGKNLYRILGALEKAPGQSDVAAMLAPRIYIPFNSVDETGLLTFGSRAHYYTYLYCPNHSEQLTSSLEPLAIKENYRITTVAEQQQRFGRVLKNVFLFLNLIGFVALLLGCIGVGSAVNVHIRRKLESAAILKCLGVTANQVLAVFLAQMILFQGIAVVFGILLGVGLQFTMPLVLGNFIPVKIAVTLSPYVVAMAFLMGISLTFLFTLQPLLVLREVSPLAVLKINYESSPKNRTKHTVMIMAVITALTFLFTFWQTGNSDVTGYFLAGALILIGVLAAFSKLLMWCIKCIFTFQWGFVVRQAFANLYRPNNRTITLMISIGTGIFFISTIYTVQYNLLNQIRLSGEGKQPNLVLFDIQPDQLPDVEHILREAGLPVLQKVPIVTMRLQALKNQPVWKVRQDSSATIPQWALVHEYRSTYRDSLIDTETIIAGEWVGSVDANSDVVPLSLEASIAENLQVDIGDTLIFDVQGVPINTVVGSIRKVNWQKVQPNFFVLFPAGILEPAPHMFVLISRASDKVLSADVQRVIVEQFPTVSVIDLELILKTAESILNQINWVIRFMAMFCILTGLVVLIATLMITRYQRIRENVLLRTLGAQTTHIYRITLIEFALLGSLATTVGAVVSLIGSWGLLTGLFQSSFEIPFRMTIALCGGVLAIVVAIGLWSSRGITRLSPLEVLRKES